MSRSFTSRAHSVCGSVVRERLGLLVCLEHNFTAGSFVRVQKGETALNYSDLRGILIGF
jgi:hypothetical protein